MYKHILKDQAGIETWANVPLVLFFAVFVGVIILFFIKNKKYIEHMENLPLDD